MNGPVKRKTYLCLLIGVFFSLILWLNREVEVMLQDSTQKLIAEPKQGMENKITPLEKKKGDEEPVVVRKSKLEPGRKYYENIYYWGDKEIARNKESVTDGSFSDQRGGIPNGRVAFKNLSEYNYGEEYYRYGQREGVMRTYFANGHLKSEATYQWSRLLSKKEYYNEGNVRMIENYEYEDKFNVNGERGTGKIFYDDGALQYEWQFTHKLSERFSKAYHPDGQLKTWFQYDGSGRVIKQENYL